jgi:hypothetical protein
MTFLVGQLGHERGTVIRPVFVRVPASVPDVSRPVQPWSWTSVLVAPLELVAVAWSVPLVMLGVMVPVGMLGVMVPVGLALSSLLWLGRQVVSRF